VNPHALACSCEFRSDGVQTYKDFERILKKGATNPGLKKLLASLGWKKRVALPKGEWRLELAFDAGVTLYFYPPKGRHDRSYLVLSSVSFRPPFAGTLPKRLTWDDDRATVESKVGKLRYDRWYGDLAAVGSPAGKRLGVTFSKRKKRTLDFVRI
jgi:hypothetical protein